MINTRARWYDCRLNKYQSEKHSHSSSYFCTFVSFVFADGGLDKRVNEGWPAYEKGLKEHNKQYEAYVYPEVNHGFHNNTTPRYDKAAADLSWRRTMDFFTKKLANSTK